MENKGVVAKHYPWAFLKALGTTSSATTTLLPPSFDEFLRMGQWLEQDEKFIKAAWADVMKRSRRRTVKCGVLLDDTRY